VSTRAVIFDFNGTISDDEPILDRLFQEVFAVDGVHFGSAYYYDRLAGLSDPEIVDRALSDHDQPANPERAARLLRSKVDRYKQAVTMEPTVTTEAAAFVRAVADRVPIAIASGALREEVEHVLELADLRSLFTAVVCIDDVPRGKPEPDGYLLALDRLNASQSETISAADVLVFEDADVGVASAHAAGMRCVAIKNPAYRGELAVADSVVERLDAADVSRLLA
jgi:beta-phosphoglucomutase